MQTYQLHSIYLPSVAWHQPCAVCGGRDCAATQPLSRGKLPSPASLSPAQRVEVRRRNRYTGPVTALFH